MFDYGLMDTIMFDVMPIVMFVLVGGIFLFVFLMMFSPRLQGKMLSRQIKAHKYMVENSKDDMIDIGSHVGDIVAKTGKNILDENEDILKDNVTRMADISKDGIETTVRAFRDGFVGKKIYCRYCGKEIEEDSRFCKYCGKEQ